MRLCNIWRQQLKEVDKALSDIRSAGIPEISDLYKGLYEVRSSLISTHGVNLPRTITQVLRLVGLSPGTIRLFHDVESGWLTEARERPGALPVYHYVSSDIAIRLLKHDLDHELEDYLMTPDRSLDYSDL